MTISEEPDDGNNPEQGERDTEESSSSCELIRTTDSLDNAKDEVRGSLTHIVGNVNELTEDHTLIIGNKEILVVRSNGDTFQFETTPLFLAEEYLRAMGRDASEQLDVLYNKQSGKIFFRNTDGSMEENTADSELYILEIYERNNPPEVKATEPEEVHDTDDEDLESIEQVESEKNTTTVPPNMRGRIPMERGKRSLMYESQTKTKGVARELVSNPVGAAVVRGGKLATGTGTGIYLGYSTLPWATVSSFVSGSLSASVGLAGYSIAGAGALPAYEWANGKVKSYSVNSSLKRTVYTLLPNDDNEETHRQLLLYIEREHKKEQKITSAQQAMLCQALAKAGPTPAESRKVVWEINHCKEMAKNIIRLCQIAKAEDEDSLKIEGLTPKEVENWRKRIEFLEPEERDALRNFDPAAANALEVIAKVAVHNGQIVEEIHRKNRDTFATNAVVTGGLVGAGTLAISGVPFLAAAIPAGVGGSYLGLRALWNKLKKRKNTIQPNRKGITETNGLPLPPEETYDFPGTLYRKRKVDTVATDAANSGNVKTFADAIRNAIPPEINDFAFFDTKHDFAKALAPYATLALKKVKKPALKSDPADVERLQNAAEIAKEDYETARSQQQRLERDMSDKNNKIDTLITKYPDLDSLQDDIEELLDLNDEVTEKRRAGRAQPNNNVLQQDYNDVQASYQAKEVALNSAGGSAAMRCLKLQAERRRTEIEFNASKADVIEKNIALRKAREEFGKAKNPESLGEFTPEEAINNDEAQQALGSVVNEKWKEWTDNAGTAVSFLKKFGVNISESQVLQEAGKFTGSVSVGAGSLYAIAAAYGFPAGLGAVLGGYIGYKLYKSVLRTVK